MRLYLEVSYLPYQGQQPHSVLDAYMVHLVVDLLAVASQPSLHQLG